MTLRFIYPVTALIAVLASGVVHGLLTDRWQAAPEPAARAARLELVPFVLGDWVGQDIDTWEDYEAAQRRLAEPTQ